MRMLAEIKAADEQIRSETQKKDESFNAESLHFVLDRLKATASPSVVAAALERLKQHSLTNSVGGVVVWQLRDHAEGKTFTSFGEAETFFEAKTWPGGASCAARLYDADLKVQDSHGSPGPTGFTQLDKWAKEALAQ